MIIKNLIIQDLRSESFKILKKAYFELGQSPDTETIVSMSLILADDLKRDFNKLTIEDIIESFRNGVRGDEFHLNVKTYYKWINKQKSIIWANETIDENYKDKRLKYRSPNNTGLKAINTTINKLNLIK